MTLGLKRGTVALLAHETEWDTEAAKTIALLRAVLGNTAVDIQHVGSTSVPSLRAKPIIDIAVAVRDFGDVLAMQDAMQQAGFYYRPANTLPGQILFARGSYYDGTGDLQTHFIHVVRADGDEWRNYLLFRDYLRANPAAAKEYEALKLRLAEECPVDTGRKNYTAGKHAFITQTLRKARI